MRRPKKIKINHNSEFDLDLAPLLAVMVKLVPVLLISSAFVQVMVVETELPQVVQEAIHKEETKKDNITTISIEPDKEGIRIIVTEKGKEKIDLVPMKENSFDFPTLHLKLVELKKLHPEVFKIEVNPGGQVAYKEIVKIMDEARQSRDKKTKFPVFDTKLGKMVETEFMFPEVIFANTMEG